MSIETLDEIKKLSQDNTGCHEEDGRQKASAVVISFLGYVLLSLLYPPQFGILKDSLAVCSDCAIVYEDTLTFG